VGLNGWICGGCDFVGEKGSFLEGCEARFMKRKLRFGDTVPAKGLFGDLSLRNKIQ
jgi:hypothetical protein